VRQSAHDLFTLPAGSLTVARVARPAGAVAGRTVLGPAASTTLRLDRWRGATLVEAPAATAARLGLDADGRPWAVGGAVLTDVRVVGGAAWDRLEPGVALAGPRDAAPLTGAAATFEALLPPGAAWARAGREWHVALPPGVRW